MTKQEFQSNLANAAEMIVNATREYVHDTLPSDIRYLVVPNCSFDGNPLEDDEEVFPDESLPKDAALAPMTAKVVADHLHRNGKIPEWINIRVNSADGHHSYVVLECCGRFTAMDKHLYHKCDGMTPFNPVVEMPTLDYDLAVHGRFNLRQRFSYGA